MGGIPRGGLVCREERPDIGAAVAAGLAGELRLKIGQPHVIGPSVCADRDRMTAAVVCAVNQQAAHAGRAHFRECDFLRADGHAPLKRSNPLWVETVPDRSPSRSYGAPRTNQIETATQTAIPFARR